MLQIIAITGPESTGKSELARSLADHFGGWWVPEYAREYLQALDRPYGYEDVLAIARGQQEAIRRGVDAARGQYLFLDTEQTVTRIWCEYKYGRCPSWIKTKQERQQFDFYLLTDIDLPWQPDPLREHPDKRQEIFDLYVSAMESRGWPYGIVKGSGDERVKHAIRLIETMV